MEKTKVYVLVDPFTITVRYIGITSQSLKDRLQNHIHDSKFRSDENYHKSN